jgi:beta-lactamase class A
VRSALATVGVLVAVALCASVAVAPASGGGRGAGERAGQRRHWHPDIAAARRYAQRRAGVVAFATIDQRGRFRGYRVRSTAPAASVFKVMLLASFLRMRDHRRLSRGDRACWRR